MFKLWPLTKNHYSLRGVDLTLSIKNERFSLIRIPRLLIWRMPLKRFLEHSKVESFYYYLHEYSYGRMITYF